MFSGHFSIIARLLIVAWVIGRFKNWRLRLHTFGMNLWAMKGCAQQRNRWKSRRANSLKPQTGVSWAGPSLRTYGIDWRCLPSNFISLLNPVQKTSWWEWVFVLLVDDMGRWFQYPQPVLGETWYPSGPVHNVEYLLSPSGWRMRES